MTSNTKYRQQLLFPSPLQISYVEDCEELNKGLFEDVKRFCNKPNDGYRSSYGGKRSYGDIFNDSSKYIQALIPHIQDAISNYLSVHLSTLIKTDGNMDFDIQVIPWAYHLKEGDFMKPHIHPKGMMTGVYYVKLPNNDSSSEEGALVLLSPDSNRGMTNNPTTMNDSATFRPKEGNLIIFPSFLPHYVNPFKNEERAVIAFDVILTKK